MITMQKNSLKEQGSSLQTHDIIPVYVHILVPPPPFFSNDCVLKHNTEKPFTKWWYFVPQIALLLLPATLIILKGHIPLKFPVCTHLSQRCCTKSLSRVIITSFTHQSKPLYLQQKQKRRYFEECIYPYNDSQWGPIDFHWMAIVWFFEYSSFGFHWK